VEIKTGERSVLSYLLSPILKYRHESLHERGVIPAVVDLVSPLSLPGLTRQCIILTKKAPFQWMRGLSPPHGVWRIMTAGITARNWRSSSKIVQSLTSHLAAGSTA
jgi:hypothetical protein